jgi:hypothetical protein
MFLNQGRIDDLKGELQKSMLRQTQDIDTAVVYKVRTIFFFPLNILVYHTH